MSNLKFVYQKRVHKVPSNVTSFSDLANTIKSIYPQVREIFLFAIINPDNTDGVAEIDNDVSFQQLKQLYKQQGWPSIKLLVTEEKNCQQVLKDSWGLLNQSLVQTERKQVDVATFFQPSQADHSQQMIQQVNNRCTQAQINQVDTAQNTINDLKITDGLRDIIRNIIDERLQFHGLILKQQEKDKPLKQPLEKSPFALDFEIQKKIEEVLVLFPQKGRQWIEDYVKQYGQNKHVDEIVEMLLQQEY